MFLKKAERVADRILFVLLIGFAVLLVYGVGMVVAVMAGWVDLRPGASRMMCGTNLRMIHSALEQCETGRNREVGVFVESVDGAPPRNWQVELLPYLEQMELSAAYRRDEPWNSRQNLALVPRIPIIFNCPLDRQSREHGWSSYTAICDGTTNANGVPRIIAVVEASTMRPWTEPAWVQLKDLESALNHQNRHFGGFQLLLHNGEIHCFHEPTQADELAALIQQAADEPRMKESTVIHHK